MRRPVRGENRRTCASNRRSKALELVPLPARFLLPVKPSVKSPVPQVNRPTGRHSRPGRYPNPIRLRIAGRTAYGSPKSVPDRTGFESTSSGFDRVPVPGNPADEEEPFTFPRGASLLLARVCVWRMRMGCTVYKRVRSDSPFRALSDRRPATSRQPRRQIIPAKSRDRSRAAADEKTNGSSKLGERSRKLSFDEN